MDTQSLKVTEEEEAENEEEQSGDETVGRASEWGVEGGGEVGWVGLRANPLTVWSRR